MKMKSWKTTSTGIIMIAGGITRLMFAVKSGNYSEEAIMTTLTGVLAGIGLIFAKDGDVTGGTRTQE